MRYKLFLLKSILLLFAGYIITSCSNKENLPGLNAFKLSYGDSILYLQNTAGDYIVYPKETREGIYSGFPEGIEINELTTDAPLIANEMDLTISNKQAYAIDIP